MINIGLLTAWLSRNDGGVFEAVVSQRDLLISAGASVTVLGLADDYSAVDRLRLGEASSMALNVRGPRQLGFAPALDECLRGLSLDLLHLHGIWQYPSSAAADWAIRTKAPLLISTHGMLDPWILGRGRLKKAIAKLLYVNRSWRSAAAFHALTEAEAEDIAASTGRRDIFVVPNSVTLSDLGAPCARDFCFGYLGRIHPKKNLDALLKAWTQVGDQVRARGARLVIAGWGEADHVHQLRQAIANLDDASIEFVGPVFGPEKDSLLRDCRWLCLPSLSEGLPMAMLEAWASGTPTLMSQHCHLPEGFDQHAAIDCGTDPDSIAAALRTALAQDDNSWLDWSSAARKLADDRFSPKIVGERWMEVYHTLLSSSSDPRRHG